MRQAVLAALLVLGSGCAIGAGPYAGYGTKRGLIYGGEASWGIIPAQLVVGMQNADRFKYGRLDVGGNPAAFYHDPRLGYGGRFGIGYGWGDTHTGGGVLATGGNIGYALSRARCDNFTGTILTFGIELRYQGGEFQVVANTRYETQQDLCIGS